MATIKKVWRREGGESGNAVRLIQAGLTHATTAIQTAFDTLAQAYVFSINDGVLLEYDPAKLYSIEDGDGNTVADGIELGGNKTEIAFVAHKAATTAHSSGSAIVGKDQIVTLTEKLISGDDNTLSDISAPSMKAGVAGTAATHHPAMVVDPVGDQEQMLIMDTAGTIQSANGAKDTNKILEIVALRLNLNNIAGGDILISGVLDPVSDQDAATKKITNALSTRITTLETGNPWSEPEPTITLSITAGGLERRRNSVIVSFDADPANDQDVRRFDLYWSDRNSFDSISAGPTSDQELAHLLRLGTIFRIRGDEPRIVTLQVIETLYAIVVAYDSVGTPYNSAPARYNRPNVEDPIRDAGGDVIEWSETLARYNAIADGSSGAGGVPTPLSDWLEATTTERTKLTGSFRYSQNMKNIRATFFLKTNAGTAYAKLDIDENIEGTPTVIANKSVQISTILTAYTAQPFEVDIDISTGLEDGRLYTVNLKTWNSATNNTNMQTSATIEIVSVIPVG